MQIDLRIFDIYIQKLRFKIFHKINFSKNLLRVKTNWLKLLFNINLDLMLKLIKTVKYSYKLERHWNKIRYDKWLNAIGLELVMPAWTILEWFR